MPRPASLAAGAAAAAIVSVLPLTLLAGPTDSTRSVVRSDARPATVTASDSLLRAMAADSTRPRRFDLPAVPVPDALEEYARQAGVRVEADSAALSRARSTAVAGTMTAPEALRRLLAGTGLAARFTAPDAARIARAGDGPGRGAHTLGTVVVRDARTARGYAALRTRSATKTDTPLRDTPQSVTVVSRALIADQAMQGMADVVRYIPGITMGQGEGHRDAPTIRGQASTADFFVDGVRDDAQYLRDVYNVERVEALKGANAMIFGRGGGGGVINRVTKEAQWTPTRDVSLTGGSWEQRRGTVDVGQGIGQRAAVRVNGLYERSNGFRQQFGLERWGVNPTLALTAGARTMVRVGYERFVDARTVDRGVPSFQGAPSAAPIRTFFGIADSSHSDLSLHAAQATLEHLAASGLTVRNRTQVAQYDKYYQNVFPGAVNAAGTQVNIAAYASGALRRNVFNQTDLTYGATTGRVRHTLLGGLEVGRQATDNTRETGYFGSATSVSVPFAAPVPGVPVAFRPSATDADNHVVADVAAAYVQDQIALSSRWQAVAGVRVDRFAVRFRDNNRTRNPNGASLAREDRLVSPRAGLVYKPAEPVSVYSSYTVSYLPSAGDQFSSLTASTQTLKPESFRNAELGVKWEPARGLAVNAAAYRVDRTNTTAVDPTNPTLLVQTGAQRTTGVELGATGALTGWWDVAAGAVAQRARVISATGTSANSLIPAGRTSALVPARTASLWNRWRVSRAVGLGLGVVHQGEMYAAISNTVRLPAFTRWDAATYLNLTRGVRAQLNVENLLNARYYGTSHGNDNIMPGAMRTVRLTLGSSL